ncbi:hypothetical protein D3C87_1139120 [compost metagenome]
MKTTLLTLLASTLLSGQAMANQELTIHCHYKDWSIFGVSIQTALFEKTAPADITISGPRLHLSYLTTIQKTAIQTRTIVGVAYYAEFGEHSSISLTHIQWAPEDWAQKAGFTGVYKYQSQGQDHEIALVCE